MEDFSRAPKIAFLSPFIERKDYQSILEIGKDSVFESIYIYPSKKLIDMIILLYSKMIMNP